jgi:hypothetical protein
LVSEQVFDQHLLLARLATSARQSHEPFGEQARGVDGPDFTDARLARVLAVGFRFHEDVSESAGTSRAWIVQIDHRTDAVVP